MPNPNVTVLEWLNGRPGFDGRVAAFGSWDVLPSIVNTSAAGFRSATPGSRPRARTDRDARVNELATDLPRYWGYGPFDAPIVYAALESRTKQPRVLYLMLGEGDEWAHEGRYDLYLDATLAPIASSSGSGTPRSLPATPIRPRCYHDRSREGRHPKDWTDHGRDVPAAERTWMAIIGPGVPSLGVRRTIVTTSQIAATIATLVGEDFRAASPQAAATLPTGK